MATVAARTNTYHNTHCKTYKKKSIWSKLMKFHRENRTTISCGILALNGSANVYPLYRTLTEK